MGEGNWMSEPGRDWTRRRCMPTSLSLGAMAGLGSLVPSNGR